MSAPKRIQLRRTKGWRKPEGAIVVARPSSWGNPYAPILETGTGRWRITGRTPNGLVLLDGHEMPDRAAAIIECVRLYRLMIASDAADQCDDPADYFAELRGHDLACWCPLDAPCHADVLLDMANRYIDENGRSWADIDCEAAPS